MAKGTSTKRSDLDAEHLTARLRERGGEQLRDEAEIWAIVDPSDLRKPHGREMPALMRVRRTGGDQGTVPGYRTLNVLGVGRGGRREILYHRLWSSEADGKRQDSETGFYLVLVSPFRATGPRATRLHAAICCSPDRLLRKPPTKGGTESTRN